MSLPTSPQLMSIIETLNHRVWENRVGRSAVESWLRNFEGRTLSAPDEQLRAMYLLTRFVYFGDREVRELLRVLYRDLYMSPILQGIRRAGGSAEIRVAFEAEQERTRFLGIGNPSESGSLLLYYFRQENRLPINWFINAHEIFRFDGTQPVSLRNPLLDRYIFLDDFAGTGKQVVEYSGDLVATLKGLAAKENRKVECWYLSLVATDAAVSHIREEGAFDHVATTISLDETFRVFGEQSRFFRNNLPFDRGEVETMFRDYGRSLLPDFPLGYGDCQLLIGFHHNTPDNTITAFWFADDNTVWTPVFRRHRKF